MGERDTPAERRLGARSTTSRPTSLVVGLVAGSIMWILFTAGFTLLLAVTSTTGLYVCPRIGDSPAFGKVEFSWLPFGPKCVDLFTGETSGPAPEWTPALISIVCGLVLLIWGFGQLIRLPTGEETAEAPEDEAGPNPREQREPPTRSRPLFSPDPN